jgi:hypothetical protein
VKRVAIGGMLVMLMSLFAVSTAQASTPKWVIQSTLNLHQTAHFLASSCPSTTACTAVGWNIATDHSEDEVPLAERWNGSSWSVQTVPNPVTDVGDIRLQGVSCPSMTSCTAVGVIWATNSDPVTESTLAEYWNGSTWAVQTTPDPTGTKLQLTAVSCASTSVCTAVGFYTNGAGVVSNLVERWSGGSWSIQSAPSPAGATASELASVSCASVTACTAVGNYTNSAGVVSTLVERWSGGTWSIQPAPPPAGATSSMLNGVSCPSASVCTAVGNFNHSGVTTLAERWSGGVWSIQLTVNPVPKSDRLFAVSCASTSLCTAVGAYTNASGATVTLAERWSGGAWALQTTPNPSGASTAQLAGVSCPSTTICTSVGSFYSYPTGFFWNHTLAERYA